jgi:hypothetical protein
MNLRRSLLFDGKRNSEENENDREPDQPHGHLGGGWLAGSLSERRDVHQHATCTRESVIAGVSVDDCPAGTRHPGGARPERADHLRGLNRSLSGD